MEGKGERIQRQARRAQHKKISGLAGGRLRHFDRVPFTTSFQLLRLLIKAVGNPGYFLECRELVEESRGKRERNLTWMKGMQGMHNNTRVASSTLIPFIQARNIFKHFFLAEYTPGRSQGRTSNLAWPKFSLRHPENFTALRWFRHWGLFF
ncbi:MAG: hypothetical protein KGN80_06730 [Acidobacteriota bacterium]|nr:hypothetical protein [Acidobacteriota bacterium]